MLDKRQIQSLHIEKSKAKLTEEAYREILREVANVSSSKDEALTDLDFRAIVKAIQAEASRRPGWKPGQVAKFKQYAGFCQLSEACARQELFKLTGWMDAEAESLNNDDFEHVMACLEDRLDNLVKSGCINTPKGIDLAYWRNRQPNGRLTSRQRHEIMSLWVELQPYLLPEKKTYAYLYGIIQSGLRLKQAPSDIGELSRRQGVMIIDALKKRIEQEKNRMKQAVPF